MKVKVTAPGVYSGEVEVSEGSTVEQALRMASVNGEGAKQILVDNSDGSLDQVLHAGQTVYVMPNIKGNKGKKKGTKKPVKEQASEASSK